LPLVVYTADHEFSPAFYQFRCLFVLDVMQTYAFMHIAEAAEIAVDLMLQEDFEHPLCGALSLYACHLRLPQLLTIEADKNTSEDDGVCCVCYKLAAK
jgi:Mitochondrial 28S ribosomal protein S27